MALASSIVLLGAAGWVSQLPAVNALLNLTATILLVAGYALIKQRRETAHKSAMLAAFAVSVVFLVCYLIYHQAAGHVPFTGPPTVRAIYLTILFSHIALAVLVPFLALATIYYGLKDDRPRHLRIARWTFPIWLYVSVTGVIVYVMLYLLYPSGSEAARMPITQEWLTLWVGA